MLSITMEALKERGAGPGHNQCVPAAGTTGPLNCSSIIFAAQALDTDVSSNTDIIRKMTKASP
jgi:hypothetical protein